MHTLEDVLELYTKSDDPRNPRICMDEQPVQLFGETRVPIPSTKDHPERVDDEYERKGTASIIMFVEPLAAFRQATARPRRTKVDWAIEVAHLMNTHYVDCDTVTLVCDNLHTHTKGAFYEAFPNDKTREYARRLNIVHTPKHGSWLGLLIESSAECELSCLTSQCLTGRRIGEIEKLQSETEAWSKKTGSTHYLGGWALARH